MPDAPPVRSQAVVVNTLPASVTFEKRSSVECLNPLSGPQWDERLVGAGSQSIFHGTPWAAVLNDTYHYAPLYLAASHRTSSDSLLPIMEVNSWLTGRRGVSLPFTDACEPIAPDGGAFKALFDHALACGTQRRWKYLELRGGRAFLPAATASQQFYVHELDLLADEAALFARLHPSVRRAIRKAEKSGLTIKISHDLDAVRQFYSLQCKTRRKHGLPPQPFRFFASLHRHILSKDHGLVILALAGNNAVAANAFLHHGRRAIYKFGASDSAFQELRGSDLVMWAGLKHYAANGFASLNLGRTSLPGEGLRRFKLGWGSRESLLDYFKFDLHQRAFVQGRDEAFGWYNRIFAALPISLSRLIGALLYRHMA